MANEDNDDGASDDGHDGDDDDDDARRCCLLAASDLAVQCCTAAFPHSRADRTPADLAFVPVLLLLRAPSPQPASVFCWRPALCCLPPWPPVAGAAPAAHHDDGDER